MVTRWDANRGLRRWQGQVLSSRFHVRLCLAKEKKIVFVFVFVFFFLIIKMKIRRRLWLFRWDSGTNVGEFDGHSRRVLSCAFKPTRPFRIVTCGEDFLVNFYEGPPFKFKLSHRLALPYFLLLFSRVFNASSS